MERLISLIFPIRSLYIISQISRHWDITSASFSFCALSYSKVIILKVHRQLRKERCLGSLSHPFHSWPNYRTLWAVHLSFCIWMSASYSNKILAVHCKFYLIFVALSSHNQIYVTKAIVLVGVSLICSRVSYVSMGVSFAKPHGINSYANASNILKVLNR